jgi:DNA adenine methylase
LAEINSPFRYAGGKFYARKLILEQLPVHDAYVEPFAGGGSIFFAKPKVGENWLNDADANLVNCYVHIRDYVGQLIEFLDGLPATKELHGYYKNEFQPQNNLERAGRWYYLNRTSYSGIMNMQNCYWGYGEKFSMRPENWARHLLRCSEKLQGVQITNFDFADVIEQVPDNTFLFIDPPYFNADQDKFYTHSFTLADHYRLAESLQKHANRLSFLLTYDDAPEIRDLYSWATNILEKQWNYTINRTDDQKSKTDSKGKRSLGREVFIMNYLLEQTLEPQLLRQLTLL